MQFILINNEQVLQPTMNTGKLVLPTIDAIHYVPLSEVLYLHSEGNYTTVFTQQKDRIMVSQHLGAFDYLTLMEQWITFFRIHQSYIVNLAAVRQFLHHSDGDFAVLHDGTKIPVARRKKEAFLEKMKER